MFSIVLNVKRPGCCFFSGCDVFFKCLHSWISLVWKNPEGVSTPVRCENRCENRCVQYFKQIIVGKIVGFLFMCKLRFNGEHQYLMERVKTIESETFRVQNWMKIPVTLLKLDASQKEDRTLL